MSHNGEKSLRPAQGRNERVDSEKQQREALAFANRRAENSAPLNLPDTALHSAQSFYLSRDTDTFIADAPFRLQPGTNKERYSLGVATSRLLVAGLEKYAKVREEMNDKNLTEMRAIEYLKTTLGGMLQFAMKRAGKELKTVDFEYFKENFLNKITPDLVADTLKATRARMDGNRAQEAEMLKTAAKRVAKGEEPGLSRPPSPDELSLAQRSFTEELFEKLRTEDGTDIPAFIRRISDGAIQHVIPTGLWRDRKVENAISAIDESVDVAPKRSMVETFLTNLPTIAAEAISKRKDLTDEQKQQVLLAAEILYTRADQLRSDRLKIVDRKTVAAETAALNQRAANAYGTLYKYGVLPALREPLDISGRGRNESKIEYQARVESAAQSRAAERNREVQQFREARKTVIVDHLLEFIKRLDSDSNMNGIFPGTLGNVLSSTGQPGRKLFLGLRDEILRRPVGARFKTDISKGYSRNDPRPYVVLDEATGKSMIPPNEMVAALEASYKTLASDTAMLKKVGDQIRDAQFEILSTNTADLITLAKRLDVLEADLRLSEVKQHLHDASQAMTQGVSRGDPGSLKWRSTSDMKSKISGVWVSISEAEDTVMKTRKTLLLKLVDLARQQMNEAPQGTDFGHLPDLLTEYELLARRKKSEIQDIKAAINFFVNE